MIAQELHSEADDLAKQLIDLFGEEDVSIEVAMQAMTRVIATCLCDQDDVLAKMKTMIANLIVLERAYRNERQKQELVS